MSQHAITVLSFGLAFFEGRARNAKALMMWFAADDMPPRVGVLLVGHDLFEQHVHSVPLRPVGIGFPPTSLPECRHLRLAASLLTSGVGSTFALASAFDTAVSAYWESLGAGAILQWLLWSTHIAAEEDVAGSCWRHCA